MAVDVDAMEDFWLTTKTLETSRARATSRAMDNSKRHECSNPYGRRRSQAAMSARNTDAMAEASPAVHSAVFRTKTTTTQPDTNK